MTTETHRPHRRALAAAADFDLKYQLVELEGAAGARQCVRAMTCGCAARALVVSEHLPRLAEPALPLLVEACYDKSWEARLGACFGFKVLLGRMPAPWIAHKADLVLGAVLHVLKDHDDEMGADVISMGAASLPGRGC
jgi:hypothetical protein